MKNFKIDFTNPWLLLLLIPAAFFTFLPYFRLAKKYRRTRNRVISVTLHAIIMVLSVCLLAGIGLSYDLPNANNELLLVVDVSYSGEKSQDVRDEFVRSVINEAGSGVKVGVVTFGYDQVYAVPLTTNTDKAYNAYLDAEKPDTSASDIASALKYAQGLFNYPETAKIVLVSDGEETDNKAMSEIRAIAAAGIKVDTYCTNAEQADREAQITSVEYPEEAVTTNEPITIQVSLTSSFAGDATLKWYDNGESSDEMQQSVTVYEGSQKVEVPYTFLENGLHSMRFELSAQGDTSSLNNSLTSYKYIEVFEDVLVIEKYAHESDQLVEKLGASYKFKVVQTDDEDNMPKTAEQLAAYDQVILANVANADLPEGFAAELNKYVEELGGGLFTFGGNKQGTDEANAYNHDDLKIDPVTKKTPLLQEMLPVQAVKYSPPAGIVFVVDISGSMSATKLEAAKKGVLACVDELKGNPQGNYVGIFTLESTYGQVLKLTPVIQINDIEEAVMNLGGGSSTNYSGAIQRAGIALSSLNVQVKRVIVVSDGQPGDSLWTDAAAETGGYGEAIRTNKNNGITCSIVNIGESGVPEQNADLVKAAEEIGGGHYYGVAANNSEQLTSLMASDLKTEEITQYKAEEFTPKIATSTSVTNGISQSDMPTLGGYYGTRLKTKATAVLTDQYNVPVYAQWKYGKGKVGSFMCDLNGTWSAKFLDSETGVKILGNIVSSLFPSESIKPQEISVKMEEDNYSTNLSIFTKIEEGDKVRVTVTRVGDDAANAQVIEPAAAEGFSRAKFVTREAGVYEVLVDKIKADGSTVSYKTYRAFSYSKEFDEFADEDAAKLLMKNLASGGNGEEVTEAWRVYETFVRSIHKEYDPRIPMAIVAIVLFLLDVAVRKFKFKWIHEIIADKKEKRLAREK